MSIRTNKLKNDMLQYDMAGIMLIPDKFTFDGVMEEMLTDVGAAPVDLFNSTAKVDLELVKTHSEWMLKFGPDYQLYRETLRKGRRNSKVLPSPSQNWNSLFCSAP